MSASKQASSQNSSSSSGGLKRNREDNGAPKAVNVAGNRRMFGALMGHLGRAQKNLKEDSDVIQMQISRRQEVSQKNSDESQRVAKLRRTLSVEQKEKVS